MTSNHAFENGDLADQQTLGDHDEIVLASSLKRDSSLIFKSGPSNESSTLGTTSRSSLITSSRSSLIRTSNVGIGSRSSRSDQSTTTSLRSTRKSEVFTFKKEGNLRASEILAELTINKLNIKSLGLIGREQELSTLKSCFSRLVGPKEENDSNDRVKVPQHELLFISGYSGIGKSTLAQSLKEDVLASNGLYVEGKYEFTSIDEPYSGVAQAFGALCNKLKKDFPADTIDSISKALLDTMREEAVMLMGLIPEIGGLLGVDDLDMSYRTGVDATSNAHERWKYAFRILTRLFTSHVSPIVFVLDDLQWADVSSLDILDHLICDVQNPQPLMIVGCYRSNEVNGNSILYKCMEKLKAKSEKFGFQITDIALESFDVDSVNTMIMTMLSIDDNEFQTWDLAEICFKRTLGNPFFLIEFMKMLQAEELLEFSIGTLKWVWDVSRIEQATMSTENAVDLLQSRIRKLPSDVQLLLQYAACLGSTFSLSTLEFVWKHHALLMLNSAEAEVVGLLSMIEEESFVELCSEDEFRWVHDKVQEAALSLSDLVNPSFQCGLGLCLFEGLERVQLESQLFDVADLINKGNLTERSDLSELNLRAAKKARNMAALQSGARYVTNGIKQLPSDIWRSDRELALQLYSIGANMEWAIGNIDAAEEYVRVVLDREECSEIEKVRLKIVKTQILSAGQNRYPEAVEYGLVALKKIGYKFVWQRSLLPVQALSLVMKTIKRLEKLPLDHFETLGLLTDRKDQEIVVMLGKVKLAAYHAKNLPINFIASCKIVELSLDRGLHEIAAASFCGIAAILMFLKKDHAVSTHIVDIAFAIQKRFGRRGFGETLQVAISFILTNTKPLHESLTPLMDGYNRALREGDNECAMFHLIQHSFAIPYITGRPLRTMLDEFPKIAFQMEEANLGPQLLVLNIFWQMLLNLQAYPSDTSKKLEGERFTQSAEGTLAHVHIGTMNLAIGELLVFFGDFDSRIQRLSGEEKGKTYTESRPGLVFSPIDIFHRGLAWYAMAQRTGKRKCRSEAAKAKKQISKMVKAGNPNIIHYDLMLSAEHAALDKKFEVADRLYKEAMVNATRNGHLHHAALFNERFAEYRLRVFQDQDDAKYYLNEAMRYYSEWGAVGKSEQLRKDIAKL